MNTRTVLTHTLLFVVTFCTVVLAGVQWLNLNPLELTNFPAGLTYAVLLMTVLTAHEMGHYIAARLHGVAATLPFFIPFPSFIAPGIVPPFGTLGAVIKLKQAVTTRKALFDIGSAGPIAGFIASFAILAFGFMTLPGIEYLHAIHPEYARMTTIPVGGWMFGKPLVYEFCEANFAPTGAFLPPMNEMYHYPFLSVGWFGMLVTGLNLLPVGQLDGGHISTSMFGQKSKWVSGIALGGLVVLGVSGFLPLFGIDAEFGYSGWLFWAFVLIAMERVFRLRRIPLEDEAELDPLRMLVGWSCFVIFLISISIVPFAFV